MGITESKQVAQAIYVACTEAEKRGSNSIEPVLTDNVSTPRIYLFLRVCHDNFQAVSRLASRPLVQTP